MYYLVILIRTSYFLKKVGTFFHVSASIVISKRSSSYFELFFLYLHDVLVDRGNNNIVGIHLSLNDLRVHYIYLFLSYQHSKHIVVSNRYIFEFTTKHFRQISNSIN